MATHKDTAGGGRTRTEGLALPVILMVVGILFLVGGAMAALSAGSVGAVRRDASSERALFAAEAGVANATHYLVNGGSVPTTFSGNLTSGEASFTWVKYDNQTGNPMTVPVLGSPVIPPGTMMVVSTGTTRDNVSRQSWALFKTGLGTFRVGAAAADHVDAATSELKAYDSNSGNAVTDAAVIACNNGTGFTYSLVDSQIKGSAFTYQNGNVDMVGNSTVARKSIMTTQIQPSPVAVPALPPAGASPTAAASPAPSPAAAAMTQNSNYMFYPPGSSTAVSNGAQPGEMFIQKNCLQCFVKPDGSFRAVETGNGKVAEGNLLTGAVTRNDSSNWTIEGTAPNFSIQGQWHSVGWNPGANTWGHDLTESNTSGNPTQWNPPPAWVTSFMGGAAAVPPSVDDPAVLTEGEYDTVNINQGTVTNLVPGSKVVVKNLHINSGGQLKLPATGSKVEIFVTGKLKVTGDNAILNDSLKAPMLNIYVTSNQKVDMSGGSKTYATVYAPNSAIELTGQDQATSFFYGALFGKSLNMVKSTFVYDVATTGVGQGLDSSTVDVLARYRP